MAINGAVKFFENNFSLFKDGVTGIASSNTESTKFILDINRYTQWESIGSSDAVNETLTITLPFSKSINSLFLVDMNFKEFSVKYFNGASFVDFTNVIGVNSSSPSGINETVYAFDTGFYQFDTVSTNKIQITCLKTQVVNVQKFVGQLIVTQEIGTFEGFPRVQPGSTRNETVAKSLSRRLIVQKTYETNRVKITFKTHPYQNDLDIIESLFDREEPFLVYPCGGRTGTQFFKVEQKNWRLKDVYNVQLKGRLKNEYEKGVYLLGFNKSITMEEHI